MAAILGIGNNMLKIIFVLFLLVTSKTYGLAINSYEFEVLEKFFRQMLLHSDGGYVLKNAKPVSMNGFRVIDAFRGGHDNRHEDFVICREGATVWKKLFSTYPQGNIIIHVYDKPDALIPEYRHFLFINKELFFQTVKQSLPLFQYALGVTTTPEKLLAKLTDSNESFHSIIKGDNVLTGILLGFGVQNSLYVTREEYLQHQLFTNENPPLKNKLLISNYCDEDTKKILLLHMLPGGFPPFTFRILPNFSDMSLQREHEFLNSMTAVSSPNLLKKLPHFYFGRLKEDRESDELVQKLEDVQSEIQEFLSTDFILPKVLKEIFPNLPIELPKLSSISESVTSFTQEEIAMLPKLIAMAIWHSFKEENKDFIHGLILGLKAAGINASEREMVENISHGEAHLLLEGQKNLLQADQLFSSLSQEQGMNCISPQRLYYKLLKKGVGEEVKNLAKIRIHCKVETPFGVLIDTWKDNQPMEVNLSDTIAGFAYGMKGMQEGESRELYIHPSVGYGIYTTLDKCVYLKAHVELISIIDQENAAHFENLLIENFDEPLSRLEKVDMKELAEFSGYDCGYNIWNHYKLGKNYYSLEQILKALSSLQSNELPSDIESYESQTLLNKLHWRLYRVSEKINEISDQTEQKDSL